MFNLQTRRDILRLSILVVPSVRSLLAASDFWNKKPAAEWSEEEIVQLRSKSPWAKKVNVVVPGGGRGGGRGGADSMDRSGSAGTFGGMTGADNNGISGGGGGRGGGGGGGGRGGGGGGQGAGGGEAPSGQSIELVVRWESARPLLDVSKVKFPPSFDGHYAVSVTGLPPQFLMMALAGGGQGRGARGGADQSPRTPEDPAAVQKAAVDRLLHSATLSAKAKDPETADLVVQTGDKRSIIFGFATSALPLAAGDKDIEFIMKLGGITVKAKFDAKEMSYKGELAV